MKVLVSDRIGLEKWRDTQHTGASKSWIQDTSLP